MSGWSRESAPPPPALQMEQLCNFPGIPVCLYRQY